MNRLKLSEKSESHHNFSCDETHIHCPTTSVFKSNINFNNMLSRGIWKMCWYLLAADTRWAYSIWTDGKWILKKMALSYHYDSCCLLISLPFWFNCLFQIPLSNPYAFKRKKGEIFSLLREYLKLSIHSGLKNELQWAHDITGELGVSLLSWQQN